MNKRYLTAFSLLCLSRLVAEESMQIPEGKIIDYPCIYPDVTPGAGPRVIDGCDVFITGDYIYWTAREDNLQYAATGYSIAPSANVSQGSTKSPSFHYRTGFKVGFGFNFGHDLWDTLFNYTWFQSNHNKGSITAKKSSGLTPTFTPAISLTPSDYFTHADTLWQLHFNVIDWELGRNFYVSKYLALRPFIGLKGTWQNQNFVNKYKGIKSGSSFDYLNQLKASIWGVGIRTGLNTTWHLSESWSLFGDLALSGLFEQYNTKRVDSHTGSGGEGCPINSKDHIKTISPVLELGLGLQKDSWFYEDRFHINVKAGWEEQIWWDQNQFSLNSGMPRGGNLTLQGFTARIRFDF